MSSWPKILVLLASTALGLSSNVSVANPVLNNIGAGQISVQQQPNSTVINQSSQKGIVNWRSFNIGKDESTHFNQPAGGVTLNRIDATSGVSQIFGRLTATGKIILINPAGVYFGPSAYVNVGGLIATTADIHDQDFLNGSYNFSKPSAYSGSIINEGQIIARNNGLVALVGANVTNKGYIRANLGKVVLASGEAFTMDFTGDRLINFAITKATSKRGVDQNGNQLSDGVNNTGRILAHGGQVLVTASAARGVLDHAINMGGIVQARSVGKVGGTIILSGGSHGVVRISGKMIATGKSVGQKGGQITITGNRILLAGNAVLDASGYAGGGNINIGGSYQGKGPLPNAEQVVLQPGSVVRADALHSGNGGNIIVWSDFATKAYGLISAQGGAYAGNGGFIETSSKGYLDVNGIQISTAAPFGLLGTWLLDPTNIYIASSLANAQGAGMSGADNSVTTSGNPFTPSGAVTDSFLDIATLVAALGVANVVVTTTNGAGTGVGDINVVNPIAWATANSLTLNAENNINVNAAITNSAGADLILNATNNITFASSITGMTGNFNLNATATNGGIFVNAPINTGAGDVTLIANSATAPQNAILQSGTGAFTTTGELSTSSTRSTILLGNNSLSAYSGTVLGTTAADILQLNNTSSALTLNGVFVLTAPSSGISITTAGSLLINGNVQAGTVPASVVMTAGGAITQTPGTVIGNLVVFTAVGGITLATGNLIVDLFASNTGGGNIFIPGLAPTSPTNSRIHNVSNDGGDIFIGYATSGGVSGLAVNIISTTGNITLDSAGNINTLGIGAIQFGNLTATAVTGISLVGALNTVPTFTATNSTSGNITFVNHSAALSVGNVTQNAPAGAITIQNTGHITTNGVIGNATTGVVTMLSDTGSFTLNAGSITSGAAGNAIVLKNGQGVGDLFTNNIGAGALVHPAGNSQIWSYSPTGDSYALLPADFVQYGIAYNTAPAGSGNGILFAFTPTLLETLINVTKVYDKTAAVNLAPANYSVSGVINGDLVSPVSLPTTGTYADVNVGAWNVVADGVISLTTPINGQTGVGNAAGIVSGIDIYGYAVNPVAQGIGTITPAPLSIVANAVSKVYGQNDPAFTYSQSGLFPGDAISGALGRTISLATQNVGSYAINLGTLTAGPNYTINSFTPANLTITPKPITVSANPASKFANQPDPAFSLATSPGIVNGLVDGISIQDVLQGTVSRVPGNAVGNYPFIYNVSVLSGSPDNYAITFSNEQFRIVQAPSSFNQNVAEILQTGFLNEIGRPEALADAADFIINRFNTCTVRYQSDPNQTSFQVNFDCPTYQQHSKLQ